MKTPKKFRNFFFLSFYLSFVLSPRKTSREAVKKFRLTRGMSAHYTL